MSGTVCTTIDELAKALLERGADPIYDTDLHGRRIVRWLGRGHWWSAVEMGHGLKLYTRASPEQAAVATLEGPDVIWEES